MKSPQCTQKKFIWNDTCDDYTGTKTKDFIGIGYSFIHNGKEKRCAVELSREAGWKDFIDAMELLEKVVNDPDNEEYKVVSGREVLVGNEMKLSQFLPIKNECHDKHLKVMCSIGCNWYFKANKTFKKEGTKDEIPS